MLLFEGDGAGAWSCGVGWGHCNYCVRFLFFVDVALRFLVEIFKNGQIIY